MSQWCTSVLLLAGKQGIILDADLTLFEWELSVRFKWEFELWSMLMGCLFLRIVIPWRDLFFLEEATISIGSLLKAYYIFCFLKWLRSFVKWDGEERFDTMSQWCASVLLLAGKQGIVLDADLTLLEWELSVRFRWEFELWAMLMGYHHNS